MKDDAGKTVGLAPKSPKYVISPSKLKGFFNTALSQTRTDASLTTLGMHTIADCDKPPRNLKLALVDLTDAKLTAPEYVSLNDTDPIGAASLGKVAAIYGAHQLKFDVQAEMDQVPAGTTSKFDWASNQLHTQWTSKHVPTTSDVKFSRNGQSRIDEVLQSSSAPLAFDAELKKRMLDITNGATAKAMNQGAGYLFEKLGFPYVTSALFAAGLCDDTKGGLFVSLGYSAGYWNCIDGRVNLGGYYQEVTASSLALYLTLVEQRRLIDPTTSDEIKAVLKGGDVGWLIADLPGALGVSASTISLFGKHGMLESSPGYAHEAMLIERSQGNKTLRYVVICLTATKNKSEVTKPHYQLMSVVTAVIIPAMDAVIVQNNP